MELLPTSPAAPAVSALIQQLDEDLATRYPGGEIHGIDSTEFERAGGYFLVVRESAALVGCGAFRPLDAARAEIKRMFVVPKFRRQGHSRTILRHLEAEIRRRSFRTIVLKTGIRQPEAITFYLAEGYTSIALFGPYVDEAINRCFAKQLT